MGRSMIDIYMFQVVSSLTFRLAILAEVFLGNGYVSLKGYCLVILTIGLKFFHYRSIPLKIGLGPL